jgi:hypothetical protein
MMFSLHSRISPTRSARSSQALNELCSLTSWTSLTGISHIWDPVAPAAGDVATDREGDRDSRRCAREGRRAAVSSAWAGAAAGQRSTCKHRSLSVRTTGDRLRLPAGTLGAIVELGRSLFSAANFSSSRDRMPEGVPAKQPGAQCPNTWQ